MLDQRFLVIKGDRFNSDRFQPDLLCLCTDEIELTERLERLIDIIGRSEMQRRFFFGFHMLSPILSDLGQTYIIFLKF
jgi:hypothetical protein